MERRIHEFGDAGIPLGCVIDKETGDVLAYGKGDTFSKEGLQRLAEGTLTYTAVFMDENEDSPEVEVHATDVRSALMWLRRHFSGEVALFVRPTPVYLGEYGVGTREGGEV